MKKILLGLLALAVAGVTGYVGMKGFSWLLSFVAKQNPTEQALMALAALTGAGLLLVLVCVPLVVLVASVTIVAGKTKTSGGDKDNKTTVTPFFTQVPKNHRIVLRNVWNSCPNAEKEYKGYTEKTEGWRFWIPWIWQKCEGLVDMTPQQVDMPATKINASDGNDVEIDGSMSYFVDSEDSKGAIKFLVNVGSEKKAGSLITQRIRKILNSESEATAKEMVEWLKDGQSKYEKKVNDSLNALLKNDAGKDYGIVVSFQLENISPLGEVKAAEDQSKAAEIREAAAKHEAAAMKTVIHETGANATVVMAAKIIGDALRAAISK